ncbi:hypothetical protein KKF34_01525 [Myxococcota bacterium]|nr:hypothetical protein [Myxococcota bacterium]MBU1380080.1 hypothetical protein [Myxococcota bacterium]MBU1495538.1 hypothetical protein [Myxococcota bacterium]
MSAVKVSFKIKKIPFVYIILNIAIVIITATSCSKKKSADESNKEKITEQLKGETGDVLRRLYPGENWDLFVSSDRKLRRKSTSYTVTSWLNEKKTLSILVSSAPKKPAIIKRYDGIIDELYTVRFGPDPTNWLILLSRHEKSAEMVIQKTEFLDLKGDTYINKWGITSSYDIDLKDTYHPPTFHYWDTDDDGVQELILKNPNPDRTKPFPWKLRWAVFRWIPGKREFVPFRGLILSPYRDQNPLWMAFSIFEAARNQKPDMILPGLRVHTACDAHQALMKLLFLRKWSAPAKIFQSGTDERNPEIVIDTVADKEKFRIVFVLNRLKSGTHYFYRLCRARLYSKNN